MKTFDRDSEESKIDFLMINIVNYNDMGLSTSDSSWNSRSVCVNFDIDKRFNIFWKSAKDSLHSCNILDNGNASILIYRAYEEYDFAMYSKGTLRIVDDLDELNTLLKIKYHDKWRMNKNSEQFIWDSNNRIYLYEIDQLYVADKVHKKAEISIWVLKNQRLKCFES